ncbi:hypothetical protein HYU16_01575 [Candidatus Woesearchaeota archaeon]|nr:hypothetical protein [Candidatus Woesearchaeota archaeon]
MPPTPESRLEEILGGISAEEAAKFKEHLEYRSPQNVRAMKFQKFGPIEGGTEKLFDDIYHSAYATAKEKGLQEKKDPKSIADALELIVVETLKKLGGAEAEHAKTFEALKSSGGFEGDQERLNHLLQLAASYLGAEEERLGALLGGLRSGEATLWAQSVRQFTNHLKDSVIDHYITQHRLERVNQKNEHKFRAYLVKHLRDTHTATPDNVARYISTLTPMQEIFQRVDTLSTSEDPARYKALGLKKYQAPKK